MAFLNLMRIERNDFPAGVFVFFSEIGFSEVNVWLERLPL